MVSTGTDPQFGQCVTVSIPRRGDLMNRLWTTVALPDPFEGALDEYFDAIVSGRKKRPAPLWTPRFLRAAVAADRSSASVLARIYPSAVAFLRLAEYLMEQLQHPSRSSRDLRRAIRNHFASYYVSSDCALTDADITHWMQGVASDNGRDPPCSFLELGEPQGSDYLARVCSRRCAQMETPARPMCKTHARYCRRLVRLLERRVSKNVAVNIVCAYV